MKKKIMIFILSLSLMNIGMTVEANEVTVVQETEIHKMWKRE